MNIGVSNPNKGGGGKGGNQFTDSQYNAILDVIYKPSTTTFSVSPASNEKGILTALTLNFNIQGQDDVFTAADISPILESVLEDVSAGAKTISGGSAIINKLFTLTLAYTRKGVPMTEEKKATFNAYTPQFAGVATRADFTTYAQMTTDLEKFVQSSATISKQSSPANQFIWFVSTKEQVMILDQNNFQQTVGNWDNGTTEFYKKPIVLKLADGVTTENVYLIRSRSTKTLTNFTYKIQ